MRKIIIYMLSLVMVFAPAVAANAASSWSITGAVSAGSRTVVSATKSGYKSAVNIAPTAGRLALKLGKGANWAALVYAAIQLAPDLADIDSFKADYAKNEVTYTVPNGAFIGRFSTHVTARQPTKDAACVALGLLMYGAGEKSSTATYKNGGCKFSGNNNELGQVTGTSLYEKIPFQTLASQILKNANAGHAPSQAATRETATEMVVGGQFDQDLLAGAVPTSDNKPLVPSVPISGNGNVTHGADVGTGDDGMSGATPGQQADAAKDAADAAKKAAQAAADAAKAAAEDARKSADDAKDLINSGSDQAAIDAANDRAKAAEAAAADSKGAADAATKAAAERARAAEAAADRARIDADARAKAAEAAADAAIAAEKAAAAADKAAAKAAADAAIQAAERARAEADARAKAAEEAAKAADRAKAEASKPFELPAFCIWAAPVCDAIDWLKRDPSDVAPMPVDVDSGVPTKSASEFDINYINFGGQCPVLPSFNVGIGGASSVLTFDMTPLCDMAVKIRPAVIAIAYFIGLGVIASAIRET